MSIHDNKKTSILTYIAMFSFHSDSNDKARMLLKVLRYESKYSDYLDGVANSLIGKECENLYKELEIESNRYLRIN